MTAGTHCLTSSLRLDSRRAIWFAQEQILAVSDLHLGYAWAHRQAGQLLPVSAPEESVTRLVALQRCYQPKEIVLLGDILHRVVDVPAVSRELRCLLETLGAACRLRLVAGNHDRDLPGLLARLHLAYPVERQVQVGPHLLLHGEDETSGGDVPVARALPPGLTIIGHEHPAIWLGDGVTTHVKCPCFLVGPRVLVLPAFSEWAAGAPITQGQFLSGIARAEAFTEAIAIAGDRLLPLPLATRADRGRSGLGITGRARERS